MTDEETREHVSAFLDTNYFLHFKHPSEVDWCEFLNARRVTLRIAHAVVEELDNKKDLSADAKLRERAAKRLVWIERSVDEPKLRAGVDTLVEQEAPSLDLESEGLNPQRPDHFLLAGVLRSIREEGTQVVLVSNDSSLRMTAKGRGVEVARPRESDRIPNLDERDHEIRRLRDRISKLEDRAPRLSLYWDTGQAHRKVEMTPLPPALDEAKLARRMQALRLEHPPLPHPGSPPGTDGERPLPPAEFMLASLGAQFGPSEAQTRQYNESLEKFFRQYEQHVRDEHERASLVARLLPTTVLLSNSGRGLRRNCTSKSSCPRV